MTQGLAQLATGDEITCGDIINTNSPRIAHELFSHGFTPGMQLSCSDDERAIIESITFLMNSHAGLIITGGLGPTTDDKTRFALARYLNQELLFFDASWQHIQQRFDHMKLELTPGNKKQCLFPENAKLLPNPQGTALGCYVSHLGKPLFMLPGPPHECLPMFTDHCIPLLLNAHSNATDNKKQLLRWRLFGLAEGQISAQLDQALAHLPCQTAYRWEYPYIEFKVNTEACAIEAVRKTVTPLVKHHVISPPEETASEHLLTYLLNHPEPLTVLDEATGGALEHRLSHPELRQTLSFDAAHARGMIIHLKGLNEYWQQLPYGTTQLTLHAQKGAQIINEQHQLPYRNKNIQSYAVEWICYRLHALLNPRHCSKRDQSNHG